VPVRHKRGITREFVIECIKQLKTSTEHIKIKTQEKLDKLGLGWEDVIIAGHSQGADMAVRFVLQDQPARAAISFCGQDPEYLIQKNIKFKALLT
jgi:predicted esterase